MTLPTFIGIGAQRAATTWAYECLRNHPQIFMSPKKEIHFFNLNFAKGISWYEEHFQGADKFIAVGEITPNYLNIPEAIPRMAKVIPSAKVFVILREPISRAYSAYKLFYNQHYKGKTFQEACEQSNYLLRLSCYAEDMRRVFDYYDRSQVGIYLYEDVRLRPYEILTSLSALLGVDQNCRPIAAERIYNPVIFPRIQNILGQVGFSSLVEVFKETKLGRLAKQLLTLRQPQHTFAVAKKKQIKFKVDPVGSEYRKKLREFFLKDILETQEIIERDLTDWLS